MRWLIIFVILLTPAVAFGVPVCGPYEEIIRPINQFNERIWGTGIMDRDQVVELWVNRKTQTWTIIVSHRSGAACITEYGNKWIEPIR
jgi:hypothetical protein